MDLYLIRHAIAENPSPGRWPDDGLRPLTEEGERRFRKAARGLARLSPPVGVVLASPYVRAWRTAELLAEEVGWPAPERCPELEAGRSALDAVSALKGLPGPDAVAMVGHEPQLGELASLLLTGSAHAAAIQMKKGGAVWLLLGEGPRPASAVLGWLLTPRVLRRLG
jgi:phosphohistidine phosphatase